MRGLIAIALVMSLAGCAAPQAPAQAAPGSSYSSAATFRASLARARVERDVRKRQLREAKQQEEIDLLTREVRELELRVSELEWRLEEAERRERLAMPSSTPSSSGCYTGPRGGRYTITKSGKKNYGGC